MKLDTVWLLSQLGYLFELGDEVALSQHLQQRALAHLAGLPDTDSAAGVILRDGILVHLTRMRRQQTEVLTAHDALQEIYPDQNKAPLRIRLSYLQVLDQLNQKTETVSSAEALLAALKAGPTTLNRFMQAELNARISVLIPYISHQFRKFL